MESFRYFIGILLQVKLLNADLKNIERAQGRA
jgi:hypothetical protein